MKKLLLIIFLLWHCDIEQCLDNVPETYSGDSLQGCSSSGDYHMCTYSGDYCSEILECTDGENNWKMTSFYCY